MSLVRKYEDTQRREKYQSIHENCVLIRSLPFPVQQFCHPNPCYNGGTCHQSTKKKRALVSSGKPWWCECSTGYMGPHCQGNGNRMFHILIDQLILDSFFPIHVNNSKNHSYFVSVFTSIIIATINTTIATTTIATTTLSPIAIAIPYYHHCNYYNHYHHHYTIIIVAMLISYSES